MRCVYYNKLSAVILNAAFNKGKNLSLIKCSFNNATPYTDIFIHAINRKPANILDAFWGA